MQRLLSILFWSVLSAAFIGPGTVTVAASAGHRFGLDLLWALTFSTLACATLQEASARIALSSGRDLGQALKIRYRDSWVRFLVLPLVVVAIVVGCAAYQAGNILGGVAGGKLVVDLDDRWITLCMGLVAGLILWFGSVKWVARILGGVVALMGVVFLATAAFLLPPWSEVFSGLFIPTSPAGSGLLVLGLVGTTVVPYNLFLGSGIARGQKLSELRFGLILAVALGGLVSMGVVVVGTSVPGDFTFENLATALSARLGGWAGPFFAVGLFSAGLSSAITAPLAAAITSRGLTGSGSTGATDHRSRIYRATWGLVLLTGVAFGFFGQKPIPIILVAQAFNGVLLPFVAVFLLLLVNDRALMGNGGLNRLPGNVVLSLVVAVTVLLGLTNVLKALFGALGQDLPDQSALLLISAVVTAALFALVFPRLWRARRSQAQERA